MPSEENNRVLDVGRLKAGGRVFVIPFRAGEGVEATDELEKAGLMFIKGFGEVCLAAESPLEFLTQQVSVPAELLIKGHVTKLSQFRSWPWSEKQITLEIQGKMIDSQTHKIVAVFKKGKTEKSRSVDVKSLGYVLGKEVAEFLLGSIQEKSN